MYPPVVVNEKLVFKLFPLVVHMSPLWWGLRLLTFLCPWYPWILCKGPTWPRKNGIYFIFFIFFFILTPKVLIRLLYLTCKLLLNHEIEGRCEPRWATEVVNERSLSLLITVEARRTGNRRSPPNRLHLNWNIVNKGLNCNQDNPLISPEFPINMEVISVTLLLLKRYYKIHIIITDIYYILNTYYWYILHIEYLLLIYTTYWILITDIYYILNTMEIIKNHMKYNDGVVFIRRGFCPGGIMSEGVFVRLVFVRVVFVRFFCCPYTSLSMWSIWWHTCMVSIHTCSSIVKFISCCWMYQCCLNKWLISLLKEINYIITK